MKKIFFFILIFLFFPFLNSAKAVSESTQSSSFANFAILAPDPNEISYDLPYPGILPDSPLYSIKVLRDKMISFLINDPLKKAEFNLLTSDKRLNAAVVLSKERKDELVISTISKSNNYFEEGIGKLQQAKKIGEDYVWLAEKMKISSQRHKQLLKEIEKTIDPLHKERLEKERKRLDSFEKIASDLSGK